MIHFRRFTYIYSHPFRLRISNFRISFQVGDKVMLPEFGGLKIEIEDKEYSLFKEQDILAKLSD